MTRLDPREWPQWTVPGDPNLEVLGVAETRSAGRIHTASMSVWSPSGLFARRVSAQAVLHPGTAVAEMRVALREGPWRIAAAWSLVAVLLATGILSRPEALDGPRLLLFFLLADPLWGGIWAALTRPEVVDEAAVQARPLPIRLPYLRPGSPAARLLGLHGFSEQTLRVRMALPVLGLALLVAGVLGPMAVVLTGVALLASLAGWVGQRVDWVPSLLFHSVMAVGLPWALGVLAFAPADASSGLLWWVGGLWTALLWLGHRHAAGGSQVESLALGGIQLALVTVLGVWGSPVWVGLLVVLFLPTWIALLQGRSLHRIQVWWTLAMWISGLALAGI